MAEFLQVFTIERRLYARQAVPWTYLILPTNIQRLRERFKFASLQQQPDANGNPIQIIGRNGEFQIGSSLEAVEQLTLEPQAVQVQISVPSGQTMAFFDNLASYFHEVDASHQFSDDRLRTKTCQTIAIVRLSFPSSALVATRLLEYISDTMLPKLSLPDAEAAITLQSFSWGINYKTRSLDHVYLPKLLTLEPRAGTGPQEMTYYTISPTDFETHKSLLEGLEMSLASATHNGDH